MTDKDRQTLPSEAVITAMADTWAERTGIAEKLKTLPSNLPTAEMRGRHDELVLRHVKLSYEEGVAAGWRAARDHYAPKLTEKEAVERAAEAAYESRNGRWNTSSDGQRSVYKTEARASIAALRAAGVQFRDKPNPEPGSCP
jgi:hypothetical protein